MISPMSRVTPLAIIVLGLLFEDDMHAYEMLRLMEQRRRDRLVSVSKGSVYHTVARLEAQGYISAVGVDRDGNRPERTRYTLLPLGRETVPIWVGEELPRTDRPASFRVALAEAHNVPLSHVIELLTQRRDTLLEQRDNQLEALLAARDRNVPAQFLIEFEREHSLTEADLQWNRDIVTRLANTTISWGQDGHSDPAQYQLLRKAAQL